MSERSATIVVIGAGQAGLSAGYHLQRRGFASALEQPDARRSFVMLDADAAPGGAWQHRWESLRMATVNGIFDLPGFPQPPVDPDEPSRVAVPRYFAAFERELRLPILRPVRVERVERDDDDPDGELLVTTDRRHLAHPGRHQRHRHLEQPACCPRYPGAGDVRGPTAAHARLRLCGGVRRAAGRGRRRRHLRRAAARGDLARSPTTRWYTRREPVFLDGEFVPEVDGPRRSIARVTADVEAGIPTGSVVSYTGLLWTHYARRRRGARGARAAPDVPRDRAARRARGRRHASPASTPSSGRPASRRPSRTSSRCGCATSAARITVRGTRSAVEPRVHLIGFGPSQSTVGANRAGRAAVTELDRLLDRADAALVGAA